MALAIVCWLSCTAFGLALLDLDAGPRLVSLPQEHGLSVVDAVGLAVLAAGWMAPVLVGRRRPEYRLPATSRRWSTLTILGAGTALAVVALVMPDFTGRRYAMGALLLTVESAAAAAVLARGHS